MRKIYFHKIKSQCFARRCVKIKHANLFHQKPTFLFTIKIGLDIERYSLLLTYDTKFIILFNIHVIVCILPVLPGWTLSWFATVDKQELLLLVKSFNKCTSYTTHRQGCAPPCKNSKMILCYTTKLKTKM